MAEDAAKAAVARVIGDQLEAMIIQAQGADLGTLKHFLKLSLREANRAQSLADRPVVSGRQPA